MADLREQTDMEQGTFDFAGEPSPAPVKLCECGCGQPTLLAKRTTNSKGRVKGQPLRVIYGHHVGKPTRFVEVGQRFGKGVVIEANIRVRSGKSIQRGARLLCDCGTEYDCPFGALLRTEGSTISCGCSRRQRYIDRTGQRYGKLVVIALAGRRTFKSAPGLKKRTVVMWLCKCDCGNEHVATGQDLQGGHTVSCGCRRRDYLGRDVTPDQAARNLVLYGYQRGAEKRGLAWELTDTDFDRLTSLACFYCGCPPSRVRKSQALYANGQFTYNGIDRIDNALGYSLDNVVTACRTCNLAKKDMSFDDFMAWIARLTEYHWFHPELTPSRLLRGGAQAAGRRVNEARMAFECAVE